MKDEIKSKILLIKNSSDDYDEKYIQKSNSIQKKNTRILWHNTSY